MTRVELAELAGRQKKRKGLAARLASRKRQVGVAIGLVGKVVAWQVGYAGIRVGESTVPAPQCWHGSGCWWHRQGRCDFEHAGGRMKESRY